MHMVWMTHPNLPDQPIRVPESAVPIHRGSGWQTFTESGSPEPEPGSAVPAPPLPAEDLAFVPGAKGAVKPKSVKE